MAKLRQTANPADKASWTEHFYTGKLNVVDGEVETDNPVWVELLRQRGFSVVGDDATAATETRVEELEQLRGAIESAETTDTPPEQEQVPAGDATLEGKVSDDVVEGELKVQGIDPETPAEETPAAERRDAFREASEEFRADTEDVAQSTEDSALADPPAEAKKGRRKKENEHDSE